ncbi:MAG: HIT family protein [Chloroflexota bacterium]
MALDSACVFCRIVADEAEASLVYRDDLVTAFLDILPVNSGHLLVVPNEHCPGLEGLAEDIGRQMFAVARRLALALRRSGVRCEGVNLYLADGRSAGQEVMHVHLHVLPRYAGDGFGLRRTKVLSRPRRADLDAIAENIRQALAE